MRKIKRLLVTLLIFLSFLFVGCSNANKKIEYEVIYGKQEQVVNVDEFNLSDIKIKFTIGDSEVFADVTEDMISTEDLALLKTSGSHEITVKYNDFTGKIKVKLFKYALSNSKAGQTIETSDFNISDIKIIIDEEGNYIDATESMVSTSDLALLKTAGEHVITINYNNFSGQVTVNLKKTQSTDGVQFDMSYYSSANGLEGNELKLALRTIISKTKHTETYSELSTDLALSDASSTSGKIILFYTRTLVNSKWDSGNTWNKEHVWPKSQGWFNTDGAGADIHHIRPSLPSENSKRGNTPYGVGSGYYTPNDNVKGDCARIIFYLLTRYKESDNYKITNVAQSMAMLLDWNELDPVDDLERQRNSVGYSIQGNRNPFIDNSDYAYYIWDVERLSAETDEGFVDVDVTILCYQYVDINNIQKYY